MSVNFDRECFSTIKRSSNSFCYVLFIAIILSLLVSCGSKTFDAGDDNQSNATNHVAENTDSQNASNPGSSSESDPFDTSGTSEVDSKILVLSKVLISENLDPEALIPFAFDLFDPDNTSNYSMPVTVTDSFKVERIITLYFRKSAESAEGSTWQWYAVVGSLYAESGSPEIQAYGTLSFTNSGALSSESSITYPLDSGCFIFADDTFFCHQIKVDFGSSIAEGGTGLDGTTQKVTATSNVAISENLDPQEEIPFFEFFLDIPDDTSNYLISVSVNDSLGIGHDITVYFRKSVEAASGNTWEWYAVVDAADSLSGITEIQAQGTLNFTNTGALNFESAMTFNLVSGGFDFAGDAAPGQIIALDFGTSIAEGGGGLNGTTQRASSDPATSNVNLTENLDPAALVPFGAFSIADPDNTSNYSILVTIRDSLGSEHVITFYFRKTVVPDAVYVWQWYAVVNAFDTVSGFSEIQAQGILVFTSGALFSDSTMIYNLPSGGFDFYGGAAMGQSISFDFGTSIVEGGDGLDGTTQI